MTGQKRTRKDGEAGHEEGRECEEKVENLKDEGSQTRIHIHAYLSTCHKKLYTFLTCIRTRQGHEFSISKPQQLNLR